MKDKGCRLPPEIMNIIWEYNADHRDQMRWVLWDIQYKLKRCHFCGCGMMTIHKMKHNWKWLGLFIHFCSDHCMEEYRKSLILCLVVGLYILYGMISFSLAERNVKGIE